MRTRLTLMGVPLALVVTLAAAQAQVVTNIETDTSFNGGVEVTDLRDGLVNDIFVIGEAPLRRYDRIPHPLGLRPNLKEKVTRGVKRTYMRDRFLFRKSVFLRRRRRSPPCGAGGDPARGPRGTRSDTNR